MTAAGAELELDARVERIERAAEGFEVVTRRGAALCRAVVLATGGLARRYAEA